METIQGLLDFREKLLYFIQKTFRPLHKSLIKGVVNSSIRINFTNAKITFMIKYPAQWL